MWDTACVPDGSGHRTGLLSPPHLPPGARQACRGFRRLDQCEHQIGPQKTKFQLFNDAREPLFHCNCTRR